MIASQHENSIFEFNLDSKDESQNLNWEATSVYIISQEDVLSGIQRSSSVIINNFDEVVKLSMDIPDDGDGILDFNNIGLFL